MDRRGERKGGEESGEGRKEREGKEKITMQPMRYDSYFLPP